jgi:hypothetical protein
MPFDTPQDAEDAFYDALESADHRAMAEVWDDSEAIACLLPMTPLIMGREVLQLWQSLLEQAGAVDIQVRHLAWIDAGDTAIHLVEEHMQAPSASQPTPPIYGMNVFRRRAEGWRLLVHQNSPSPPPLVGVPGA